jgi:hypothetical protein
MSPRWLLHNWLICMFILKLRVNHTPGTLSLSHEESGLIGVLGIFGLDLKAEGRFRSITVNVNVLPCVDYATD